MRYLILSIILCASLLSAQNIKRKGYLGVALYTTLPDSLIKKMSLATSQGALVKAVLPGSTAQKIGVLPADLIVECNAKKINSAADLILKAQEIKSGDKVSVTLIRNNKKEIFSGISESKPLEQSAKMNIEYGEFKFENTFIRTIYRSPKDTEPIGTVYFIQGIPCYSLDNMKEDDPTKLALNTMIQNGFAVYIVEKLGMGDSYSNIPCSQLGFNKELEVFKEGYKNLVKRKDIDTNKIFIFGHSLGGVTAPILAQQFQPKGVIVYGTVLKPWSDYLLDAFVIQKRHYKENLALLQDTLEFVKPFFYDFFYGKKSVSDICKTTKGQRALEIAMGYDSQTKLGLANRTLEFHKEINQHNLPKAWKNTRSYVMAIYGESDIAANNSVDHKEIINCVNEAHPGKGEFVLMPRTNHMFQEIGTMEDYIKMQQDPVKYEQFASTKFNTKLFELICNWMQDKLSK